MSTEHSSTAGRVPPHRLIGLAIVAPLVVTVALAGHPLEACIAAAFVVVLPLATRRTIDVRILVGLLTAVVFLVPDRFAIGVALPIDLEPYRIVFGCVALLWLVALLTDPDARLRGTVVDIPLLLIFASILLSVVANPQRTNLFGDNITKVLLLFSTYILIVYLIRSAFEGIDQLRRLISFTVALGTAVAGAAVIETVTAYNVFDELLRLRWLSALPQADIGEASRGEVTRAMASASHPIALGAALAMLFPLAAYLAHRDRRWLVSVVVLPAGMLATVSRTPIIMLVVVLVVIAMMRPAESLRLLVVIAMCGVVLGAVFPTSLVSVVESFFPAGGILAEQSNTQTGNESSRGRLADLSPVIREWASEPIVGEGFGSRPVDGRENALIDGRYAGVLDNQWLDLLLETGLLGVLSWVVAFIALINPLVHRSRVQDELGMLCVSLTASLVGFVVAMIFLDAFAFPQLTFVFFFIVAIAAAAVAESPESVRAVSDTSPV